MRNYESSESLEKIVTDAMANYPCCVCGKPAAYFLKAKNDIVCRAYCEKCSGNNHGQQN